MVDSRHCICTLHCGGFQLLRANKKAASSVLLLSNFHPGHVRHAGILLRGVDCRETGSIWREIHGGREELDVLRPESGSKAGDVAVGPVRGGYWCHVERSRLRPEVGQSKEMATGAEDQGMIGRV